MNTIIAKASDIPEFIVLPSKLLTRFLFDEFKMIIHDDTFMIKARITIHNEESVNVELLEPKDSIRHYSLMKTLEDYNGQYDFYDDMGRKYCLCDALLPGEEFDIDDIHSKSSEMRWSLTRDILKLMAYIMNKGFERSRIIRKSGMHKVVNHGELSTNKKVYLLDDIVNYVSDSFVPTKERHEIQCPCWEVRGHYRHYKSGKVVFIPSYRKGKQRDTEKPKDKEYYA